MTLVGYSDTVKGYRIFKPKNDSVTTSIHVIAIGNVKNEKEAIIILDYEEDITALLKDLRETTSHIKDKVFVISLQPSETVVDRSTCSEDSQIKYSQISSKISYVSAGRHRDSIFSRYNVFENSESLREVQPNKKGRPIKLPVRFTFEG